VAVAAITVSTAQAYPVTVDGLNYEVTLVHGTFAALPSELTAQIWFGDEALASSFSDALGFGLGYWNDGGHESPYFAFAAGTADSTHTFIYRHDYDAAYPYTYPMAFHSTWAVATAVPEPGGPDAGRPGLVWRGTGMQAHRPAGDRLAREGSGAPFVRLPSPVAPLTPRRGTPP
jgi:hypothetical protein